MTLKNYLTAKFACLLLVMAGMLVLVSCGGGSSSSSSGTTTTTTPVVNNSVALTVGFGPNGQAGGYYNDITTTVTICPPGSTSNCQTVDNVLVDTGSIGLRILSSAFTTLQPSSLGTINDANGDQLQECVQYGDTSYSWGPMWLADVQLGGETTSNIAIQVIGGNAGNPTFSTVPSTCLAMPVNPNLPNGGNEDTVATFGANGVLGVGPYPWDCGSSCTSVTTGSTYSGYPYYICPTGGSCEEVGVPNADQAVNAVAAFTSSDNNGVMISLDSVPATGAATGSGTMYFGIGTQTNNGLGSATIYAYNSSEYLPTVVYNGIGYTTFNIFDTGSPVSYISDASTLGITDCADNGLYCPGSTLTLSNIALTGNGSVGSGTISSLSIANADALFAANPTFAAFNNLATDGGTSPATDEWDFGLPFFFVHTVFVGIANSSGTAPTGASAPYGYVAF
jgi:hypothetical protein